MTPQNIITDARYILNDTDETKRRNTDAELLGWVNDALAVAVDVRPDLFSTTGDHTCSTGAEQTASFARCVRIQEVVRVVGGGAVLPSDRGALDAFKPAWYADAAGAAVNWLPHSDPQKFYLYPPAANTQHVEVRYVESPATLALTDTVPVSDNYRTALVNFVVGYAETKDDESVNSNRAAQAKSDFIALLGKV